MFIYIIMSISLLLDSGPKPWANINVNNMNTNDVTINGVANLPNDIVFPGLPSGMPNDSVLGSDSVGNITSYLVSSFATSSLAPANIYVGNLSSVASPITVTSTNGMSLPTSAPAWALNTPQDIRTTASPSFVNVTANLIGNASTSTSSTNFSGALVGDVTGNQGATVVSSVGGSNAANVNTATLEANAATDLNTSSTIVKRDAGGNFSASTITANLTGNVSGTASNVTSIVAIANGGTGNNAALANGKIMVSDAGIIKEGTSSTDPVFISVTASGLGNFGDLSTFTGGIKLYNAEASYSASILNNYEEFNQALLTSGAIVMAVAFSLTRVGRLVTLIIQPSTGVATATDTINFIAGSVPARFIPKYKSHIPCVVTSNGVYAFGDMNIDVDGSIIISVNFINFVIAQTVGWLEAITVSWQH